MITLRAGDAALTVAPERGAAVTSLTCGDRHLLVPVPPGADPNGAFHGGFWMAPWTNRLDGGRIEVAGTHHALPVNRPAEGTAIHGFVRDLPWRPEALGESHALLTCRLERPPFVGHARLTLQLAADRLQLDLVLANEAMVATPLGIGWHPYFPRPAGTRLRIRTRVAFGRDDRNLPVAPRPCAGLCGSDAVLDGLDTHLAGWNGEALLTWPDGRGLTMQAQGAWASNLQVFAPRGAGVLAIEPVSHVPDAPNRAAAARHGPMHLVQPGEAMRGSLMIHWC